MLCGGHAVGEQIDPCEIFRSCTPLDELPQPSAGSAANLENVFVAQVGKPMPCEESQNPPFAFLQDK